MDNIQASKKNVLDFRYQFWSQKSKFDSIFLMFSSLIDYEMWIEEKEAIQVELMGTNNDMAKWGSYVLKGKPYTINLKFAFDSDDSDIVHFEVLTQMELAEKIEMLDLFQSLFSHLIE